VTGVASFGIFITLDTLFVEGMVHVSELGSDYFQYNESMKELRGERTGMRYRLTDAVQVQVSRVDLEARRIEFRLVKGTGFKALKAAIESESAPAAPRKVKRAAPAKPAELKGTSRQRRAQAKRAAKAETAPRKSSKGRPRR
jgi:ribonuclease R